MICAKCQTENPDGLKFCNECGAAFKASCASCGFENALTAKFCGNCGSPIAGSAAAAVKQPRPSTIRLAETVDTEALEGERKTVTALFADIKGSMELMEDLDPEEALAIIDPALKLMMDAVRRYDGYIVQSTGDGIFALFGAPVAHEDHPQRALYAALRMQDDVRSYADRLRADGRAPLQIRVGVNSGEVVVRSIRTTEGKQEYTPIGHTANLASRLQALANPGSTVLAEGMRKQIEGYFTLKALGASRVKGMAEPVLIYEVTGFGPLRTRLQRAAKRGYTKFVGREHEMEALEHSCEIAKRGRGQIVAVIAEAGVGKSRLFYEFKVKNQTGWMLLETVSVSHGKASAYMPVIDLLHGYFDIKAEDDGRKRREKVAGKIAILDRALEDTLPYLFGVLGLVEGSDPLAPTDAEIRRRRTLDAIKRVLLRESLNQPLMLVFEDLQWIDSESQGLLNLLADSIGTAKILLLVNYRPEYRHDWGNKTYYTQLRLDPLAKESADEMLAALLGNADELGPVKRLIIDKTEGNPFFMEEIVQGLFEEGVLARDDQTRLARPLDAFQIPATVQVMLAARIDRLPAEQKDLLQILAVLGKEFRLSHLRVTAAKSDEELERRLAALQLGEFIYERPAANDIEYIFKHALTQEVAYNSILSDRRKALHERAGRALETLCASQLDDYLDELARHYSRSANLEKAAQYLRLAAGQARSRGVYPQAVAQLKEALELLRKLPADQHVLEEELTTQLALASTLFSKLDLAALAQVESCLLRAGAIASQLGNYDALLRSLDGLRFFYRFRGEIEQSRVLAEEALATALAHLPGAAAAAHLGLADSLVSSGEFEQARYHFERAQSSEIPVKTWLDSDLAAANYCNENGLTLWILGYPAQAAELGRDALTRARSNGEMDAIPMLLMGSALLHQLLDDWASSMQEGEEALRISEARGTTPFYSVVVGAVRGWALAKQGRSQEGLLAMRQALAAHAEAGAAGGLAANFELARLAELCGEAGEAKAGLDLVNRALDQVATTGLHICEAELRRIKGELLLNENSDNCCEAGQCFRSAIEIARHQKAKSWELRATTSLARLLIKQRRRNEARTMLAEIYNWFTEGFDTPDLQEATQLLNELDQEF